MFPFQQIPNNFLPLNIDLAASQQVSFPSQYLPKQEIPGQIPQIFHTDPQQAYANLPSLLTKRSPPIDLNGAPSKHLHQEPFPYGVDPYRAQELAKQMGPGGKPGDLEAQKLLMRGSQDIYGLSRGQGLGGQQFQGLSSNGLPFQNLHLSPAEAQALLGSDNSSQAYIRQFLESKGMNPRDYGQQAPNQNESLQKYITNLQGLQGGLQGNVNLQNLAGLGNIANLGGLGGLGPLNNIPGLGNIGNLDSLAALGGLGNIPNLGNLNGLAGYNNLGNLNNLAGINNPLVLDQLLNQARNQQLLQQLNGLGLNQSINLQALQNDPSLRGLNINDLLLLNGASAQQPQVNLLNQLGQVNLTPTTIAQSASPNSIASKGGSQNLILQRPEALRQQDNGLRRADSHGRSAGNQQQQQQHHQHASLQQQLQLQQQQQLQQLQQQQQQQQFQHQQQQLQHQQGLYQQLHHLESQQQEDGKGKPVLLVRPDPNKAKKEEMERAAAARAKLEAEAKMREERELQMQREREMAKQAELQNREAMLQSRKSKPLQIPSEPERIAPTENVIKRPTAGVPLANNDRTQKKAGQSFYGSGIEIERQNQNLSAQQQQQHHASIVRPQPQNNAAIAGLKTRNLEKQPITPNNNNATALKPNSSSFGFGSKVAPKLNSSDIKVKIPESVSVTPTAKNFSTDGSISGENLYKTPEKPMEEEKTVQKTVLTRIGSQYQVMIPDMHLNEEEFEDEAQIERNNRRGDIKLVWDPYGINSKDIAYYIKSLHRVLGTKVINQEKALKLLCKKNFNVEEVLDTVRKNERHYSNFFGISNCTRELRSRRSIE